MLGLDLEADELVPEERTASIFDGNDEIARVNQKSKNEYFIDLSKDIADEVSDLSLKNLVIMKKLKKQISEIFNSKNRVNQMLKEKK